MMHITFTFLDLSLNKCFKGRFKFAVISKRRKFRNINLYFPEFSPYITNRKFYCKSRDRGINFMPRKLLACSIRLDPNASTPVMYYGGGNTKSQTINNHLWLKENDYGGLH